MGKVLNVNDMLELAEEQRIPGHEKLIAKMEKVATELADAIAAHYGIAVTDDTDFQNGFGGLCATFVSAKKGQRCPKAIHEKDEGGDWH